MDDKQPIIIKRVKKVQGGHHGGSWKIAMADFAIAMMAFFLLMWLLANTTMEQKIAIQGYFVDPVGFMDKVGSLNVIDLGGNPSVLNNVNPAKEDEAESIDQTQVLNVEESQELANAAEKKKMESLKASLLSTIQQSEKLKEFQDQLIIDIAPDGLHIQIIDKQNRPMFDSGSDKLKYYFAEILLELAPVIAKVNNKISITGHTDGSTFADRDYFSNWELSTDRANAARRMLVEGGLPATHVAEIGGFADSIPFDPDNPLNAMNRRIEVIVLNQEAENAIQARAGGIEKLPEQPEQAESGLRAQSKPGEALLEEDAPAEDPETVLEELRSILKAQDASPYVPPDEAR